MATGKIFDPKTPPTDRCAIASPTGGGFRAPRGQVFTPESLTSTPPHAPFRALQITRFKDFP
ncbi:hypothetical protein BH10PSE3_BH10PSE3_42380 [soil metagenome]